MPKRNVVQDVIPAKKSIRNVVLPSKLKKLEEEKPISSYTFEYDEPKKPSKKVLYVSVVLFFLAVVFGISNFFKSARVIITPKQDVRVLDADFKAVKNLSGLGLSFQIVSTIKSLDKTVISSGQEKVSTKARGNIVIYNNTSGSQKLVATTRFQTPEGLIFRALSAVNIPAKQIVDGKPIAGSIEVAVEADKAGIEYNIGLKDFTIPGFKGDPKYTLIYARSKTEMKGGFIGSKSVVTKEVSEATNKELEDALRPSLLKDITSQIPENFVLYTSGVSYQFDPINEVNGVLRKRGVISAIIFDKASLSSAIVAKTIQEVTKETVLVSNLNDLDFNLKTPTVSDLATASSISFNLKGDVKLVWTFDENRLKSDLLGLSKISANTVISTYPSIKESGITTYPFWNQTIPSDSKKVTLINTLAK